MLELCRFERGLILLLRRSVWLIMVVVERPWVMGRLLVRSVGVSSVSMCSVGVCPVGMCSVGLCPVGVCPVCMCSVGVCSVGVCSLGVCFVGRLRLMMGVCARGMLCWCGIIRILISLLSGLCSGMWSVGIHECAWR